MVMPKILQFKSKDKSGKEKINGKLEIKNESENAADLYFYGDICGSTWDKWHDEDICPQDVSDFLNQLDGNEDINIFINSGGGEVFAGLAIYNVLKRNPANKTVHVDGLAASAASVIAMAGDKIIIPATAQMMIHKAWGICIGNANDMTKFAGELDKCDESILNVYAKNLKEGVSIDTIKQMVDDTTWLTGEDAAKYFNVEVEEGTAAVAYVDSQYFDRYKNLPECLKKNKIKKLNTENKAHEIETGNKAHKEKPKNDELNNADAEAEAILEQCNFLKLESEVI